MRLEALASLFDESRFPAAGERAHPERATVVAARAEMGRAIVDDELLADCIGLELERIRYGALLGSGLRPFYAHPDTGVSLAFAHWPPGATAGAHEHTAWTITAVCRNELHVLTFDRDASYRRGALVSKNRFAAPAGATGFIFEPCIHDPQNISDRWSLSLHAISPRDGEPVEQGDGPLPGLASAAAPSVDAKVSPYASLRALRIERSVVAFLADILATMRVSAAERPLRSAFRLAPARVLRITSRTPFASALDEEARVPYVLERAQPELRLGARLDGDTSLLYVEAPFGESVELSMSAVAHDAIAFAAVSPSFGLAALPGSWSDDERCAVGLALEETGLFKRVFHD